jgi:UrcA family protein
MAVSFKESAVMAGTCVIRRSWKYFAGLWMVCGGFVGAPLVSAADAQAGAPQEVVRIGDLNLGDSRGVAAAYNRLQWAAQRVCPGTDSLDYWVRESAAPCVVQAISRAIASIGSQRLAAYAQAQPLFRLRHAQLVARAD